QTAGYAQILAVPMGGVSLLDSLWKVLYQMSRNSTDSRVSTDIGTANWWCSIRLSISYGIFCYICYRGMGNLPSIS
ncbi:MAG: hypothetical protein WC398_07125, partial [Bacteroidales bacterium]